MPGAANCNTNWKTIVIFRQIFTFFVNYNWNNNLPGQLEGSSRILLHRSSNQSSQLSAQTEAYHMQFPQFKAIFHCALNMFGNLNR